MNKGRNVKLVVIQSSSNSLNRIVGIVFALASSFLLTACGVNDIPTYEEQARARWSEVESQYQRRADLIPNLVQTVKGFAVQERQVLTDVIEARAKATQIELSPDMLSDPDRLAQFQDAQEALSGTLSRLLLVVERYPDLKSSENFLALQSQLEGSENRIAVARRDYIDAVRLYNTELKTFPGVVWKSIFYADRQDMPLFEAAPGAEEIPKVSFSG